MKAYINFGTTTTVNDRKTHTNAIQGVGEWVDISSLILDSGFSRTRRIGESGRFTRSVLKFQMKPTLGNRYIANEILTADGDIRAKFLTDDNKPYFIGTIRPLASLTASSYLDSISLEVIDDSYFLEWVNTRETIIRNAGCLYNASNKSKSLIHMLLAYTGGNLTNLKITADSNVGTPVFNALVKIEKGKGVKTVIDDVFYEYNLQYRFLEDGTMHIFKSSFDGEKTTALKTLNDKDFVKKLTVSRSEDGRGGVVVKWHQGYTGYRTIAKYDLSKFLGLQEMQDSFIANGEAVFEHPDYADGFKNGKGYVDFPDVKYRYLDISDTDIKESEKNVLSFDNATITCECPDSFIKVTGAAALTERYRLGLSPIIDKSKLSEHKIGAYLHITPFSQDGDSLYKPRRKFTHLKAMEIKAKCLYYDDSGDYYEYILGDDNMGANEYTEYKCKYIVGTEKAPNEIIALANRLFVERANGGTTYQTEVKKESIASLKIGGVYRLESKILGLDTLIRLTSIVDKGDSKNGVLATVKFQGWQDVNTIGTGTTSVIEKNTKAELKKQFRLDANTTIVNSDDTDGYISILATGDVVDLYKSDITWLLDGDPMPSIYKTSAYSISIPNTYFEKATTLISAECKECDGTTFETPLIASVSITKPQGAKGEKGDKGDKGDTGEKGDKGEDGKSFDITISPSSYFISSRGSVVKDQTINLSIYANNITGDVNVKLKEPYGGITVKGANYTWVITIPKGEKHTSFSYDVEIGGTVLRSNTVSATIQESRATYLGIHKTIPVATSAGEPLMDGDYFLSDITVDKEKTGLIPNSPYIYKNGAFTLLQTTDPSYSAIMGTILGDALENGGISDDNPMYTFISKLATKDAFIQSLFSQDINISGNLQSNNFKWESADKKGFRLDAKTGMAYLQDAIFGGEINSDPLITYTVKAVDYPFTAKYLNASKYNQAMDKATNVFKDDNLDFKSIECNGIEYKKTTNPSKCADFTLGEQGIVSQGDFNGFTHCVKFYLNIDMTRSDFKQGTNIIKGYLKLPFYHGFCAGNAKCDFAFEDESGTRPYIESYPFWKPERIELDWGYWYVEGTPQKAYSGQYVFTVWFFKDDGFDLNMLKYASFVAADIPKYLWMSSSGADFANVNKVSTYQSQTTAKGLSLDIVIENTATGETEELKWLPFSADYDSEIKYVYINDYCNSLTLELNKVFQADTTKSKMTVNGTAYTIKSIQVTSSSLVLTTDTNTTLTYSKSSYVNISGSIGIMPQNAKVEATDIFPKLNNTYNLGSSAKKWNSLYTTTANTSNIYNSGTIKSPYIIPNSNGSGYVGSTGNYFSYGAMNTLYANYLKTISGGYHLGNLVNSAETTTDLYSTGSNGTTWTKVGTIFWNGLIVNSQPSKFAIFTGHEVHAPNSSGFSDCVFKIMLPQQYKFKRSAYNWGDSYIAFMSPLTDAQTWGGSYQFGMLPTIRIENSNYTRFNKTTEYFCANGDVMYNPTLHGFQILVLGFIQ